MELYEIEYNDEYVFKDERFCPFRAYIFLLTITLGVASLALSATLGFQSALAK